MRNAEPTPTFRGADEVTRGQPHDDLLPLVTLLETGLVRAKNYGKTDYTSYIAIGGARSVAGQKDFSSIVSTLAQ